MTEPRFYTSAGSLRELILSPNISEGHKDAMRYELALREAPHVVLVQSDVDQFAVYGPFVKGEALERQADFYNFGLVSVLPLLSEMEK